MARKAVKEEVKVTSIEQLKQDASGELVELPKFKNNSEFVARLRRPSLLKLVRSGKIPNTLLTKTNELFIESGKGFDTDDTKLLDELFEVLEIIAGETFVEPKYEDIVNAGIELTDEQLMFLFTYSQRGVQDLESFRTE
jgi:hypothetical protein